MSRKNEVRPHINVTPLVDVVLVLLIIFMVVTPMLASGVAMDLPKVTHPDPDSKGMDPLQLTVVSDGTLMWNRTPITREDLAVRLRDLKHNDPGRNVLILADRGTPFGHIREVLRLLQDAEWPGTSLKVTAGDEKG